MKLEKIIHAVAAAFVSFGLTLGSASAETFTIRPDNGSPDLGVSVTATETILQAGPIPGTRSSYFTSTVTVNVKNNLTAMGRFVYGSTASQVMVKIDLGYLLRATPSIIAGGGFQCSVSGTSLTCLNGTIAAGSSVNIVFDIYAPESLPLISCVFAPVKVTVDPEFRIQEMNETNNTADLNVQLSACEAGTTH